MLILVDNLVTPTSIDVDDNIGTDEPIGSENIITYDGEQETLELDNSRTKIFLPFQGNQLLSYWMET